MSQCLQRGKVQVCRHSLSAPPECWLTISHAFCPRTVLACNSTESWPLALCRRLKGICHQLPSLFGLCLGSSAIRATQNDVHRVKYAIQHTPTGLPSGIRKTYSENLSWPMQQSACKDCTDPLLGSAWQSLAIMCPVRQTKRDDVTMKI
jgi:hypothetical protein